MNLIRHKLRLLFLILIGVLAGALWATFFSVSLDPVQLRVQNTNSKKFNILFISLCSLRKEKIDLYNSNAEISITPNIDLHFKNAFLFKNAFSSFGWTNMALYFPDKISEQILSSNGYVPIGLDKWNLFTRIPKDLIPSKDFEESPELYNNQFKNELEDLKKNILTPRKTPFFLFAHFKYMHFPYMDMLNNENGWKKYLNEKEILKVQNLILDKSLQITKPLLYIALTGKYKPVEFIPEIKSKINSEKPLDSFFSLYDIFSDKNLIERWKEQPDYNEDLNIIDKIYSAKLNYIDSELKELFNLYNDDNLKKNTVVILTGDHGEALMQHDILGHASHVYDEIITHPLLVRFPLNESNQPTLINEQFYQGSFTDISKKIMSGDLNENNFIQELELKSDQNQYIISRNCSNSIQSVRFNNQWKYIIDYKNNRKFLYNLKEDPKEKIDILDSNSEIADQLDLYLNLHRNKMNAILDISPCKYKASAKD